jgi:hypothetical protein
MPHFHFKKWYWLRDYRITIVKNNYVINIWEYCSQCNRVRNPLSITCSNDPGWVGMWTGQVK